MTLVEYADQLTTEWALQHRPRERSLVEYVLAQLAQPGSDYAGLLEDICRQRWTGAVAS
jgi:hypothetical protein